MKQASHVPAFRLLCQLSPTISWRWPHLTLARGKCPEESATLQSREPVSLPGGPTLVTQGVERPPEMLQSGMGTKSHGAHRLVTSRAGLEYQVPADTAVGTVCWGSSRGKSVGGDGRRASGQSHRDMLHGHVTQLFGPQFLPL